ncbi:helix-turn-helix transcriptional regulator [Saccharothrix syringae]|nr:LuxR C-terminal-related transcriptional regulator [Saccharothrix syringae]
MGDRLFALVERNHQLDVLKGMLRNSAGKGCVVLVRGPVGGGKTALLHAFSEHAADVGAHWVEVAAGSSATGCPGLLDQLAAAVGLPGGGPAAAVEALREAAGRVPLVVAVDDLHRADEDFLAPVPELAGRLSAAGVLLVLVCATAPGNRWGAVHAELLRQPRFRSVRVSPLSPAGVGDLLHRYLKAGAPGSRDVPESLAATCHAVTGGNPLLVRAVAEDLRAADRPDRAAPWKGEAFTEAVLACLRRCGPDTTRVARGLAVLGAAASPGVLARMLDLDEALTGRHLDALAEMGLLVDDGAPAFRHPAGWGAVLSSVDPGTRAGLHARAATARHELGAPSVDVAAHLLAAGRAPGPWAVAVLRDAAGQAVNDDLVLAVRCLELARELCADERERAEVTARLVEVGWWLDPAKAAGRLPCLTEALADGRIDDHDAVVLGGQLFWHGRIDEAVEVFDRLVRDHDIDPGADAELRVMRLWMGFSCPALLPHVPEARSSRPATAPAVTTASEAGLRALEVLNELFVEGPRDDLVEEATRILEVCSLRHMSLGPSRFALQVLVHADRLEEAGQWCDTLLDGADERGAPSWQAIFVDIRARIALLEGRLPDAERYAREALDLITPRGWGVVVGAPLSTLVQALVAMGRYAEAAVELDRPVPPAMFRTRWGVEYLHTRGHYYLGTRRLRAALGDFLSAGETLARWGLDSPALLPWRSGAAEAYLRAGEPEQALRLLAEQAGRPGGRGRRLLGVAGRIRAGATPLAERARVARAAVEDLEACGAQLELARALACLAESHRVLGDSRRARMVVRRALHIADVCGAEPLVAELTANSSGHIAPAGEPAEAGRDAHGIAALSEAERRVAELAFKGHTNKEIARTLHVTISTVEQHLTRVYRKLNVRRRTDLPVDLELPTPRSSSWSDGAQVEPDDRRSYKM